MPVSIRSRHKQLCASGFLAALMFLGAGGVAPARADAAFDAAVKSYKSRNFREAVAQFTALKNANPKNATIHYYLALSYQGVGNRSGAKSEYEWIVANDRTQLKSMAEKGLQIVGGSGGSVSVSGSSSASDPGNVAGAPPAAASSGPKVKTIIDFYTTWCGPCKKFEPIFDEVKRKYPDITFKRLDAEDSANADLVERYGVKAYPTIVKLDGGGKVLSNSAGAPRTAEDFEAEIKQFR